METSRIIASILVVGVCSAILYLTLKSHWLLRKRRTDTMGKKAYRWLLVLFSLNGILWGLSAFTYVFLFCAVLVERLVVYKGCYGNKTRFGKLLTRINW